MKSILLARLHPSKNIHAQSSLQQTIIWCLAVSYRSTQRGSDSISGHSGSLHQKQPKGARFSASTNRVSLVQDLKVGLGAIEEPRCEPSCLNPLSEDPSDDLLPFTLHVSERQCNASTRVDLTAPCSPQVPAALRAPSSQHEER